MRPWTQKRKLPCKACARPHCTNGVLWLQLLRNKRRCSSRKKESNSEIFERTQDEITNTQENFRAWKRGFHDEKFRERNKNCLFTQDCRFEGGRAIGKKLVSKCS